MTRGALTALVSQRAAMSGGKSHGVPLSQPGPRGDPLGDTSNVGEEDRINTAEGARRFFDTVRSRDKRMHLVPGGYHEPHNDPGSVNTA